MVLKRVDNPDPYKREDRIDCKHRFNVEICSLLKNKKCLDCANFKKRDDR